ncbi:hypothetical protein CMUS01_05470 [Colletotrichum musicola]|uniref:Uncharacterized protein n=1 Tax=Colletotrichum musicola TaxID=2175873 RepID=A0A8H6KS98_9PEZI|nr:hypothetical protein CMUS01_05470 [Colletotrichum musicola]
MPPVTLPKPVTEQIEQARLGSRARPDAPQDPNDWVSDGQLAIETRGWTHTAQHSIYTRGTPAQHARARNPANLRRARVPTIISAPGLWELQVAHDNDTSWTHPRSRITKD